MHKPDPVESILARLMPPAMSESGMREIEAMIDDLAEETLAGENTAPRTRHIFAKRAGVFGSIAAAGVAAALIFQLIHTPASSSGNIVSKVKETPGEVVLVGETDRVESMTDEGWREDSDGSAMRAMRLNLVEENSLLDEETGIVMKISQPREEYLLMPVSAF